MALYRITLLAAALVGLVGCLDYEKRLIIAPDGEFVGHMVLTGPDWLMQRWGLQSATRDSSAAMARENNVKHKPAGRGVFVAGHKVQQLDNRLLKVRYEQGVTTWTFAAAVSLEASELREIRTEMEKRSLGGPAVARSPRLGSLAKSLYAGSNIDLIVDFPYSIQAANAAKQVGRQLTWNVPLAELENGVQWIYASGEIPPAARFWRLLAWFLPTNEPD